jgi:ankyrin repeat protein
LCYIDFQQLDGSSLLQGVSIGGNTVLHIAATSSAYLLRRPTDNYLEFVKEICSRDSSLLTARNKLMETALHCAVKAGNYRIVSLFISLAEQEQHVEREALLKAKNVHGETALHEAVRIGHCDIVNELISFEPRLTGIVDAEGVSPLYVATMMNRLDIVRLFTREEPLMVSSAGPNGQTALHAAVLEHAGMYYLLLPVSW